MSNINLVIYQVDSMKKQKNYSRLERNRAWVSRPQTSRIQHAGLLALLSLVAIGLAVLIVGARPVRAADPVTPAANQPHALAQRLFQGGAMSCAARANQIANFVSTGPEIILMQMPSAKPDQSMLMATLLPGKGSKSQVVSILSMAPNQYNGCGANYQSIKVSEKSCVLALNEDYATQKPVSAGDNGAVMIPLNQNARVIAVPVGKACLMIKQELL